MVLLIGFTKTIKRSGTIETYRTPTYCFTNKATLYKAVLLRLIDDEKEFVKRRDLLESDDIVGRIKDLLCTHIDFISLRPTYVQLIYREALDNNGILLTTHSFLAVVEQGKELIELARNRGIIASQDSDSIFMYSLSITWFPFLQKDLIAKSLKINPFSEVFYKDIKILLLQLSYKVYYWNETNLIKHKNYQTE